MSRPDCVDFDGYAAGLTPAMQAGITRELRTMERLGVSRIASHPARPAGFLVAPW